MQRTLPEGVLAGLATGQYSLHGGVVRNAAGQIVRHLIPVSSPALDPFGALSAIPSIYNVYQLNQLKSITQALTQIAQATMLLSGLNLAISVAGFAALYAGLRGVDKRLEKLDKKIDWIHRFLSTEQRARLLHAVEQLSNLPSDLRNSFQILHATRETLGQCRISYLQHWDQAEELDEFMSYQHYFCTAFLAQARCSAELGMQEIALDECQSGMQQWHERSRRVASEKLLRKDRARFLYNKGTAEIPAAKIAGWMDFAYSESRGYEWIDELRKEFDPSIAVVWPWQEKRQREDMSRDVRFLDNLTSRSSVLLGYEAQLKFFADHRLKPSQLDAEIKPLLGQYGSAGMLMLAPAIAGEAVPFTVSDITVVLESDRCDSERDHHPQSDDPDQIRSIESNKIGELELLRHLDELEARNKQRRHSGKTEPFVGLSWFVKTYLGSRGFDISHSYGLINALEKQEKLET